MKRIKKKIALGLAILSLFAMCNFYVAAQEPEGIYEETHDQINLTHVDVKKQKDSIEIFMKHDGNLLQKFFGRREKKNLENLFVKLPELESVLIKEFNFDNELCAIAYTEMPVEFVDGHAERIRKKSALSSLLQIVFPYLMTANAVSADEPTQRANGNFYLLTTITKDSSGVYTASTIGMWQRGSFIGGENYPASGRDFVLQAAPGGFNIISDQFSCVYTKTGNNAPVNTYNGVEGDNYFLINGDGSYIEYEVEDDPFGMSRLHYFFLDSKYYSSNYSGYRTMNSYYVHTWKSMSLSVSASVSAKACSLNLTPSIADKSWQAYNYVSFNF